MVCETRAALFSCKMVEGASVSSHVIKMTGYIKHLERLGFPLDQKLAIDTILHSLSKDYNNVVMTYYLLDKEKSIPKLHSMLITAETYIDRKPNHALMVKTGKVKNKSRKSKTDFKGKSRKKEACFHCNEPGHWKRNSKLYLEELKKQKAGKN